MTIRLQLLTIDLDDTLWPCASAIDKAEDALYRWLAQTTPRVTEVYDRLALRHHRQALAARRPEIAHDLTLVRRDSLREILASLDYHQGLADQALAVFLDHRNRVQPYPDVIPALRTLGAAYRLVSVTNGNADVARTPLAGLFHLSLTAAAVGARKPHPAIFQRALEWAGAAPERALHLGDDPWLDIEPARRLGMVSVWVNRDERVWPDGLAAPDAEVSDLAAVLDLLDLSPDAV